MPEPLIANLQANILIAGGTDMKNIAFVTVGMLLAALALAGIAMAQQPSEDAILSALIARIENGLIPGVIVRG